MSATETAGFSGGDYGQAFLVHIPHYTPIVVFSSTHAAGDMRRMEAEILLRLDSMPKCRRVSPFVPNGLGEVSKLGPNGLSKLILPPIGPQLLHFI